MPRKSAVNKSLSPEQHPYYHSTKKLLINYRDVVWHLEVESQDLQTEVRAEYGHALDDCLSTMEKAGAKLNNATLEGYANTLERNRKMLHLIDSAISIMRHRHKRGEQYYWVLYYTFLSPQEYESINDILTALEEQGTGHAQSRMVTDLYAHTHNEDRRNLAQRVEEDFFQKSENKGNKGGDMSSMVQLLQDNPDVAKLLLAIMDKKTIA